LLEAATTILLLEQGNQAADHLISRKVSGDLQAAPIQLNENEQRLAG
jgi:hypothetical protein